VLLGAPPGWSCSRLLREGMGLMRLRGVLLGLVGVLVLGLPGVALAAEGGGCPNEALRQELGSGFLPDCRAYEMVTPVFKEGYEFFPQGVSSDGDRTFLYSYAAVAGAEGSANSILEAGLYLDTRTAGGWRLESVNAPASEFIQKFIAGEPGSGESLWEQHTPAQSDSTHDLYIRSAKGVYSLVGPLATPENSVGEPSNVMLLGSLHAVVLGATSDYGHVVISAEGPGAAGERWPFDETIGEAESLYEYSGTGNEQPILVGVGGGEKGGHDLLGKCGTRLGSRYLTGSAYNALSGDGETIFFTVLPCGGAPAVSEVWARRHGSSRSSLPAESVDVSARAPEPACTGACRLSPESDKEFEGASENGERVFFTSTQQLLDGASQDPVASDNATTPQEGGCSVTTGVGGCNLYEYDLDAPAGDNLRLVAGGAEVLGVARVAENGSRVYFVAKGVLTTAGNEFRASAVAGQPNLYVYDTEEAERDPGYKPVFIATLSSPGDAEDWRQRDQRPVEATADGRFLLFVSSRPGLTPGDTGAASQLFEYDAQTGELVRISQGEDGYNDNGNSASVSTEAMPVFFKTDFHPSINLLNISEDGMTVAFETTGRLSALATAAEQGCTSVYEYRNSGSISNGGVRLISDGVDVQSHKGFGCGVRFNAMDASGANILFATHDPLSASDTDGVQPDVYDARVGGGFPLPPVVAGCEGDACLGAPAASPVLAGPGSTGVSGGGNLAPVVSSRVVKSRANSLTRAQKLAIALRACRRGSRRGRGVCEARARKRYGLVVRVSKASGRGR
jgi:hypothetical protein